MSLIKANSKKLLKPFYTYTQENIQYIPYKNYSLELILLFLQNLNMMEPGLINIIKECLFLNLNKYKTPFIDLEHINLFYFGSKLSIGEEFDINFNINIKKENSFYLKEIFIYDKVSTYEKQSYQFLIKHISLLKEKLLIYYYNKDFKILNLNGLINSIKQQKILELSKFEFIKNIKNIKHNEDIIQEDLIKNEKQIEQYNILMKIFNEQIEIYISKIDSIKLKYESQLDKNSIF
jgi:hypothetical protein